MSEIVFSVLGCAEPHHPVGGPATHNDRAVPLTPRVCPARVASVDRLGLSRADALGECQEDLSFDRWELVEKRVKLAVADHEETRGCLGCDGGCARSPIHESNLADELSGAEPSYDVPVPLNAQTPLDDDVERIRRPLTDQDRSGRRIDLVREAAELHEILPPASLEERHSANQLQLGVGDRHQATPIH